MKNTRITTAVMRTLRFSKRKVQHDLTVISSPDIHSTTNRIFVFVKLLLPIFILSGCTIQYPIWLGHEDISQMCEQPGTYAFTHQGNTKEFSIHLVDHLDIPKICGIAHDGNTAQACIINNVDIYVAPGNSCPDSMAHELSHGFGLHFVDRPIVSRDFNHG